LFSYLAFALDLENLTFMVIYSFLPSLI
jgi:hypothetical protein